MAEPSAPPVTTGPVVGGIDPPPSAEVVAAIAAAVEVAWPRPLVVRPERPAAVSNWRFSGRWWSRPAIQRRERPWW